MNYEIVDLKEKVVAGLSVETSNDDPQMTSKIGGLWNELYQGGVVTKINNRANDYAIGLYSDYTSNGYTATVGMEVTKEENADLSKKIIPSGKYAKFTVHGHMQQVVAKAWEEIWAMDLDRSYTADFEEYLNCDFDNADINIYIALK